MMKEWSWYYNLHTNKLAIEMARDGYSTAAIIDELLKRKWMNMKSCIAIAVKAVRHHGTK